MSQISFPLWILLFLASCSQNQQKKTEMAGDEPRTKLKVAAVNYPLAYFAERIGGEHVEVIFPAPPDIDPAFWIPGEKEIIMYQESDLILLNGAGYAKWIAQTSLPSSRLVNTSQPLVDHYIETTGQVTHTHGGQDEHTHSELAITTWLDMKFSKAQALVVGDALVSKMPGLENELRANLQALIKELYAIDDQFARALDNYDALYCSHPVYQYLARAYNVKVHSVHWEPGQEISRDQWHEFEHIRDHQKASVMLWEGEPAESVVQRLRDQGVRSVVFDPCANRPDSGDFIQVMAGNAQRLTPDRNR